MDTEDNTTAIPGSPVTQFAVFLENRVGALLSLVRLINDHHAEVIGLSVLDSVDVTIVRVIVTDPDVAETVFMEKGISYSSTRMCVVQLGEGAAGLSGCLAALLEGETNLHFSYPLMCRPNGKTALAMALEDVDFGTKVLQDSGFRVLYQEDLSR